MVVVVGVMVIIMFAFDLHQPFRVPLTREMTSLPLTSAYYLMIDVPSV
jgi:hypothetical protein